MDFLLDYVVSMLHHLQRMSAMVAVGLRARTCGDVPGAWVRERYVSRGQSCDNWIQRLAAGGRRSTLLRAHTPVVSAFDFGFSDYPRLSA
jgi:hypothetical protein